MSDEAARALESATAADAMNPHIVRVPPDTGLVAMADAMATHRIHCLVVEGVAADAAAGEQRVWGLVTDIDLVRALDARESVDAGHLAGLDVATVDATQTLDHVVATIVRRAVSHLVVVDGERPVGIISTLDIAAVAAGYN